MFILYIKNEYLQKANEAKYGIDEDSAELEGNESCCSYSGVLSSLKFQISNKKLKMAHHFTNAINKKSRASEENRKQTFQNYTIVIFNRVRLKYLQTFLQTSDELEVVQSGNVRV